MADAWHIKLSLHHSPQHDFAYFSLLRIQKHCCLVFVYLLQAGMKAREQALFAALDDMESWLATGTSCTPIRC